MLPGILLLSVALAEPGAAALLPFGVDLYIQKKPVRGLLYTVTQAVGVAAVVAGTVGADRAAVAEDDAGGAPWRALTAGGVTLAGASYVVSTVDASNLHQQDAVAWMRAWDAARLARASSENDVSEVMACNAALGAGCAYRTR